MMMWAPILSLLFLIVLMAFLLASVAGLSYLWYRALRGRSGGDLPTCATCGYAVRGLQGLNCPECGADLREVGIVTPKQRGAVSPVMFVLLWTLLLPGPSCLVSGLLVAVGPKVRASMNDTLDLTPVVSGQYLNAEIDHLNGFPFGVTAYTSLSVEGNNTQSEYLDIDPGAMTYEDWWSNATTTTKPLDRQAILEMLKRAGADIKRQDVMDETDELLSIIQGIPTQGLANLSPNHFTQNYNSSSYDQPAVWFMGVLLGLWILVWIGGLWVYFRIRRKHQPTQAESP